MLKYLLFIFNILTIINNSIQAEQTFKTEIDPNQFSISHKNIENQLVNSKVSEYEKIPTLLRSFYFGLFGAEYFYTGQTAKGVTALFSSLLWIMASLISLGRSIEVDQVKLNIRIKKNKKVNMLVLGLFTFGRIAFLVYNQIQIARGQFKDSKGLLVVK